MLLRYFYNERLAHASYLLGCQATGEALIVDPGRDIDPYLSEAEAQGMRIAAVAETHIHADFLSGARELAERTDARLYLSDEGDHNWKYTYLEGYDHVLLKDGDTFSIGNILLEVLHTPGHTPEHIALMVTDTARADAPMGVFTGDFVFVGDVGRPDLLEQAAGLSGTAEPAARRLYHSLQRFKQLPDYLQVWPAHGAGSACGKALGAVPSTTVGYEKRFNWALQDLDESTFVASILQGQPEAPCYFAMMKRLNKEGPPVLHGQPVPEHLPFTRLPALLEAKGIVVDTRAPGAFAAGHIPGTINIPFDTAFTTWAGWVVEYSAPFYLIADPAVLRDITRGLQSIGLDNVAGYVEPSALDAWLVSGRHLQSYDVAPPEDVAERILRGEVQVVDVRATSEWAEGHLPGAKHMMLGYLVERMKELRPEEPTVVHCLSGSRSAIGASLLQAGGIQHVTNLLGGYQEWARDGLPILRDATA